MIISKTPYRISFFGGGTDYPEWYLKNGGEVISSTIEKFLYITCRNLPPFFSHKHRIVYSKVENVKKIENIKHNAVREALKIYKKKIKNFNGLEIHYDGDLPARSGMGSSSTFVVGLINALNSLYNIRVSKKKLSKGSIYFEQKILKETVGSQDQIAASYGGFNSIKFNTNNSFSVTPIFKDFNDANKFSDNLILVFSGINRTAKFVAKTYVNKLSNKKENEIKKIFEHVKLSKKFLKNKNFDDFGRLLHETWMIKKSLSNRVSTDLIDDIYKLGINSGALGGKLLGAGGGGFVLFYVRKNLKKEFFKKMRNYICLPVKFTTKGSTIIKS